MTLPGRTGNSIGDGCCKQRAPAQRCSSAADSSTRSALPARKRAAVAAKTPRRAGSGPVATREFQRAPINVPPPIILPAIGVGCRRDQALAGYLVRADPEADRPPLGDRPQRRHPGGHPPRSTSSIARDAAGQTSRTTSSSIRVVASGRAVGRVTTRRPRCRRARPSTGSVSSARTR